MTTITIIVVILFERTLAAYVFLIFSSYATDLEEPWAEQIRLKETELIRLFGWDKRTDITIAQKLKKIGHLVELVCSLSVLVKNINIGAKRYNVERGAMWILEGLVTRWLKGQRTIQPKHREKIKALLGDFD